MNEQQVRAMVNAILYGSPSHQSSRAEAIREGIRVANEHFQWARERKEQELRSLIADLRRMGIKQTTIEELTR